MENGLANCHKYRMKMQNNYDCSFIGYICRCDFKMTSLQLGWNKYGNAAGIYFM